MKNLQKARRFLSSTIKKVALLCVLLFFIFGSVIAQESVNSAGGDTESSTGSVSFSVGQVFLNNNLTEAGQVAEGVQLPYEIYLITSLDDVLGMALDVKFFPNPVADILTLLVDQNELKNLEYQLININGQLLDHDKILQRETYIDMAQLDPAVYFVHIFQDQQIIKTFRILKR